MNSSPIEQTTDPLDVLKEILGPVRESIDRKEHTVDGLVEDEIVEGIDFDGLSLAEFANVDLPAAPTDLDAQQTSEVLFSDCKAVKRTCRVPRLTACQTNKRKTSLRISTSLLRLAMRYFDPSRNILQVFKQI